MREFLGLCMPARVHHRVLTFQRTVFLSVYLLINTGFHLIDRSLLYTRRLFGWFLKRMSSFCPLAVIHIRRYFRYTSFRDDIHALGICSLTFELASDALQMLFAAFSSVQLRNRKAIAMKSNERARCCLIVPASVDVAFLVAGRIVAICLGLLALVVGIVLSSIPWVDYLILRVSTEVAWAREDNSFASFVTSMKNSIIE